MAMIEMKRTQTKYQLIIGEVVTNIRVLVWRIENVKEHDGGVDEKQSEDTEKTLRASLPLPSITNIQQVVGGSPIDQHLKRPSITNIHPAVEDTEIVLKDQHLKTFSHQHSTICERRMVDVVVGILSDKLLKVLESEWHRQLALGELFNKMNDELLFMRSFLQDVERVRRKNQTETLKIAKKNLMELVYDAEDAIADCQVQFAEQHKGSLSKYMQSWSPKLINFRREMTKRLMVINQGIEEVKKSMISYLSTAPTPTRREEGNTRPLSYPILINDDKIVGLEDGLDTIERWVLQTDELFTMIGIVGMGGIGKSTLAQKICSRLKHSFEYIAFVPVSQCLKFEDVLLEMLREKIASKSSHSGGEVHELLDMLKRELEDKKYLLVLDDVWETAEGMWWDNLNSILPKRNGGCVIVTTRKLKVAGSMGVDRNHIHQVKTLSHDDSWSLFTKIAFARTGGKCCNPDLEHFGKEIIARCEGLPLAITAVGGMMLAKGIVFYANKIPWHMNEKEVLSSDTHRTMVDAVVGILLDKLLALLVREGQQLLEFDSQFDKLKDELGYMQGYIKEADQVGNKRPERIGV
ncbi:hypothetical protein AAC387_Pa07g3138 [Persea americana]